MLDPTLRATLEQRLGELQFARTLEASPTQTIKPVASASKLAEDSRLPVISLMPGDGATDASGARSTAPDLELRALLGEGGMGKVELAFQRSLEREVAVKTTRVGSSPGAAAALVREARIAGTLEHPGIVPVHALGLDGTGSPVLVMKRVEGQEWAELIADANHPAWAARPGERLVAQIEILMQVCRTVQFAHKRGVLHLDVKPENVMVGDFGEVYLVDWGIARRFDPTSTSPLPYPTLAGTPAYMAPEMVAGAGVDARTDVFLLGATLHAALTGGPRNEGDNVAAVLTAAIVAAPRTYDATVPAELAAICNRATAREPADRYESAEALRLALAEHLQHRSSIALADEARERSDALAELLAAAKKDAPPADIQRAYQLANEARFGFEQALREWSENPVARAARADCIARAIELELRQGHVEAAEAALHDLERVPPTLREQLARVREARAKRAAEDERLRAMAHDLDVNVSARQRWIAIGVFAISTIVGAGFIVAQADSLRPRHMLWVSLGILVASMVMIGMMRRRLLANAFNRQAAALFLLGPAGMSLGRGIATVQDLTISATVTLDILVLVVVVAAAAATILRRLWIVGIVLLASLITSALRPSWAIGLFALDIVLLPIALIEAFYRHGERHVDPYGGAPPA